MLRVGIQRSRSAAFPRQVVLFVSQAWRRGFARLGTRWLAASAFALSMLGATDTAWALTDCRAEIRRSTGAILVSANDVKGTLMWSFDPELRSIPFHDARCLVDGQANSCKLGPRGSSRRITPPDDCVLVLRDNADACAVHIARCVVGDRPLPRCLEFDAEQNAVTFTRCNVQIRDGSGSTAGCHDGTGNLVLGHADMEEFAQSHNLVVGGAARLNVCDARGSGEGGRYGAVLTGRSNQTPEARYAVAIASNFSDVACRSYASHSLGINLRDRILCEEFATHVQAFEPRLVGSTTGLAGVTVGEAHSAHGGLRFNTVLGNWFAPWFGPDADYGTLLGGLSGVVRGPYATVIGVSDDAVHSGSHDFSGSFATLVAGGQSAAGGHASAAFGGFHGFAQGAYATVTGGEGAVVEGVGASSSGGMERGAHGMFDWVGGGLVQDE